MKRQLCGLGCCSLALLPPPELCSRLNLRSCSGIPALINKYVAAGAHTVSSPQLQDSSLARPSAFIPEARTEVKCCERKYSPMLSGVPMPSQQAPCGGPSLTVKHKEASTFLTDMETAGTSGVGEEERTL